MLWLYYYYYYYYYFHYYFHYSNHYYYYYYYYYYHYYLCIYDSTSCVGYSHCGSGGATPGRARENALSATLAVKSGNNKIMYQDIATAPSDATNDLSMPCHEQRNGAAIAFR